MGNSVLFELSMLYDAFTFDFFKELIGAFPFKVKKMSPATLHKTIRFNEEVFYSKLAEALERRLHFSTTISQDFSNSCILRYDDISAVITIIAHLEECEDINILITLLNRLFNNFNILTASIREQEDGRLSTAYKISSYERRGIDTSNLKKKIWEPFNEEIIDIEQFSRHSHEYGGIIFTSTYMMWFGKDFFKFVPKETLTSFSDCVLNEVLDNGSVRIQLYEDINDYNTDDTDRRQWAFRKHTNIDEVAEKWNAEYRKMASENMSGANMIIENGSFEHGGVRRLKVYLDKDRKQTVKKEAVFMKVIEYDSCNKIVYEEEVIL